MCMVKADDAEDIEEKLEKLAGEEDVGTETPDHETVSEWIEA